MHKAITKFTLFVRWYGFGLWLCVAFVADEAYAQAQTEPEELWLAAQINQFSAVETLLFLKQTDGRLLVAAEDWQQQWRLKAATGQVLRHQGQDYYYLDELQGVSYQINMAELSIAVTVDVSWFQASTLSAQTAQASLSLQSASGAFFNYDISSGYQQQSDTNLFVEGVWFNPMGVMQHQLIARQQQRQATRLNSSLVKDDIEKLATLTLGDTVSRSGLRFAGVQWASNFNLQPMMSKLPLPQLSGQALLPATVDIFINNIKSISKKVPAGEFVIDDVPIISGQGEARMVVKDILDREQVVIVPYYASPDLLKVGLQEYAFELGFVREQYGIHSANYGSLLALVSHRQGIYPKLTSEFEGQWQQQQQTIRYGAAFVVPQLGAVQAWLANSWHQQYGAGHAQGLSLSRQNRYLTVGLNVQQQSPEFVHLAALPAINKDNIQVFLSVPIKYGSLRTQYTSSHYYNAAQQESLQAGYSFSLGRYASLSASFSQELQAQHSKKAQLSLTMPLFNKNSFSLSVQPYEQRQRFSVQKSVPAGSGIGYALSTETGDIPYALNQAAMTWQHDYGTYRVRATEQNQQYAGEISLMGSMVWLDKQWLLSRRIDNSFAVAQVADLANVNVYSNNQLIGQTNTQGKILIPRLQPYQKNILRVDAVDLPFDVEITSQEQEVVPSYRSGLLIEFPVKRAYGATLTLVSENGQPVPAGTFVVKQGSSEEFLVGYRGELYITGLSAKNTLVATWKNQQCTFEVNFVAQANTLPDLGTHICRGIQP